MSLASFIQETAIHGLGEYRASQQWSALPELGVRLRVTEHRRGTSETRQEAGPTGEGEPAEAEWADCDWWQVSLTGVSC